MANSNVRFKVSGTGWLCAHNGSRSIPVCKLTQDQITAWSEVMKAIDSTPPRVETVNVINNDPVSSIVLSAISRFIKDKSFYDKFGGTSPNVDVQLLVNGHHVPVIETLADIYNRMYNAIDKQANEKALQMVTESGLEPIADALRQAEYVIRERLNIVE